MDSEYIPRSGTRCLAPEMELFTRACRAAALRGKAWHYEAKPGGGVELPLKDGNITTEKARKSRQMQFHDKTAYVWGLRYR